MPTVAVTVQGVTLSQIHPVLDGRNQPILEPSSFDINTSIQRCLVKAIALHGLGLYIYAGEDLPDGETPKVTPLPTPRTITVTSQRLYTLARFPQDETHVITLRPESGVSAYAFTFG